MAAHTEYPWSTHDGRSAVSFRGVVETSPCPGAPRSLKTASRFEKPGTLPLCETALTPITWGSAAG